MVIKTVSIKNLNQGVLSLKKYNPLHCFATYFLCAMGSSPLILNSEKSKKHKHMLNWLVLVLTLSKIYLANLLSPELIPATLFLFKHICNRPKLSGPFVILYLSHCPSFSHPFSSRNFPFLLFLGSQTFPHALSFLIFKIYTFSLGPPYCQI